MPRKGSGRIQVNWRNYVAQHWRKPVSLVASEDIVLEPLSQTIVPVQECGERWDGVFGTHGLITPNRSKQVVNSKFSTAYGIAASRTDLVVISNPTRSAVKIRKNCQVAEFHQRDESAFSTPERESSCRGVDRADEHFRTREESARTDEHYRAMRNSEDHTGKSWYSPTNGWRDYGKPD